MKMTTKYGREGSLIVILAELLNFNDDLLLQCTLSQCPRLTIEFTAE